MGASGVTVIMAASQAVDPGSTPGWRTLFSNLFFLLICSIIGVVDIVFLVGLISFRTSITKKK